jgi:hypothetical protein
VRAGEQACLRGGVLAHAQPNHYRPAADPYAWARRTEDGAGRTPGGLRARAGPDRVAHGRERRALRPVDAQQARLEPGAQRVVAEAEQVHRGHVRIALGGAHEL